MKLRSTIIAFMARASGDLRAKSATCRRIGRFPGAADRGYGIGGDCRVFPVVCKLVRLAPNLHHLVDGGVSKKLSFNGRFE
jgi:hypothetical protein